MPAEQSSIKEQRINELLYAYWDNMRGSRSFPAESEIEPDELSTIWESCFLVHVPDNAEEHGFQYTFLGEAFMQAFGGEEHEQEEIASELATPNGHPLAELLKKVIKTKAPVHDESEFTNRKNMVVKYRCVLLPLGEKPDYVDYVIGGMKWKAF